MKKLLVLAVIAASLGFFASSAEAQSRVSVGVSFGGGYYAPSPVYYAPAPVYYAPAPVYYAPAPVYYAPAPVYHAPRRVVHRPRYHSPCHSSRPVHRGRVAVSGHYYR